MKPGNSIVKRRIFPKRTVALLSAILILFASGCIQRPETATEDEIQASAVTDSPSPEPTAAITPMPELTEEPTPEPTAEASPYGEISDWTNESEFFTQIPDSYYFGSGAGGWKTILTISNDGSFTGNYHDWDAMGPDGIMGYQVECNFSGQFGNVEKIADHTYTMEVISLQIEGTEGERYLDEWGTTHETTLTPYGFNDASLIYVYTPGTEIAAMPEKFVNWYGPNGWPELYDTENEIITQFALYNYYGGYGFFEWEDVPPPIDALE